MKAEIDRLRQECAEAYQVIGELAGAAGIVGRPDVVRILDNLSAAAEGEPRPHADVLPFAVDSGQPAGAE